MFVIVVLNLASRRQGETLRELYTRLDTACGGLSRKSQAFEPLRGKNFTARMLRCFPSLEYTLKPDKLGDTLKILKRGYSLS
ncbi:hypothetical protein E2C01_092732 [Portunus trituberculatus]|uniref:Uncharacterized protein n=1 Tax=Portunus trituberculatus TaxID=210409 RepID=A0A5B7JW82_PORTR|nr:hypothetical protein [Portunus trituberculatus]